MNVRIRHQGSPFGGKVETFEEVELITLGRDPAKCQVVFPADETKVAREHCALRRVLGEYRLVLRGGNQVLLDGKRAHDGSALGDSAELQLGPGGPKLLFERSGANDLPSTALQGQAQPGPRTMVERLRRSSARLRWSGAATFVVLAGAGVWLSSRMNEVEAAVVLVRADVASLSEGQRQRLDEVLKTVEALDGDSQQRMTEVLAQARPSVYMVLLRNQEGGETPFGTAWVAGEGVLATNAHVAEGFDELAAGVTMFARSNTTPAHDFTVKSVRVHPGYEEFPDRVRRYLPARLGLKAVQSGEEASWSSFDEAVEPQQIPACDVALMYVEGEGSLGRPLPIESEAFEVGQVVGLVGYPMEQYSFVNDAHPTPQTLLGHITAISDNFFAGNPEGLLVQHSIRTAGGASGSPILSANGHVLAVHNATNMIDPRVAMVDQRGNVMADEEGNPQLAGILLSRVPAGPTSYAQRARLVKDLMDGTEPQRMGELRKQWDEALSAYHSMQPSLDEVLAGLVAQAEQTVDPVGLSALLERQGSLEIEKDSNSSRGRLELDLHDPGRYLLVAMAENRADINLALSDASGAELARDDAEDWYPVAWCEAQQAQKVVVTLSGPAEDIRYQLHAYYAAHPTAEQQREQILAEWTRAIDPQRAELVDETETTLLTAVGESFGGDVRELAPTQAARHLVIASSLSGSSVALEVSSEGQQLGLSEFGPTVFLQGQLDPGRYQVRVLGTERGGRARLYHYVAGEPSLSGEIDDLKKDWRERTGLVPFELGRESGVVGAERLAPYQIDFAPGSYLVLASSQGLDIDLHVFEGEDLLASETSLAAYSWVALQLERRRTLTVAVAGEAGTSFDLSLYRGDAPGAEASSR